MKPLASTITPLVQRQEAAPEEEELQAKPLVQRQEAAPEEEELQAKPLVQRQEAAPEEEELQAKPLVQRQEAAPEEEELQAKPLVQRQEAAPEEEELQVKPLVQRQEAAPQEEEELQAQPLVQRQEAAPQEEQLQAKRSPDGNSHASNNLESQLGASKGSGSPLPDDVRSFMEPRFGADFSQVRVHTDSQAIQMNQAVGAQAFTHGSHIYFGAGKSPGISDLTAHELTHVVQQTGGVQAKLTPSQPTRQPSSSGDLQGTLSSHVSSVHPLTVQRFGGEYVPEMSVKPDSATVLMGKTHTEQLNILNTREAPRGTTFHWGGGVSSPHKGLQFESIAPNNNARAKMQVKGTAPGEHEIQANTQHQVPGGPAVVTPGPPIPVTVPTPSVTKSWFRENASGEGDPGDVKKLSIGDKIVLRMNFTNFQGPGTDIGCAISTTGPGLSNVLEQEDQIWNSPTQLDLKFQAKAVGEAYLDVKVQLGDMTEAQAFTSKVEGHVQRSKDDFLHLCGQVNTIIDAADRGARAWLASISLAYREAWKNHTDALKDQADFERLVADLILGAALAFIPGGVGGVVGARMKRAEAGDFLIDGVKDLAKWGTGRNALVSSATRGGSSAGLSAFPTDPGAWKDQVELRITQELLTATNQLEQWQDKANRNVPGFYMDFNPVEAMRQGLTLDGHPAASLQPVDQAQYALDYEKGFWSAWLEKYGHTVIRTHTRAGRVSSSQENAGKKVKARCEAIGLDITPYMEASRRAAEEQAAMENEGFFGRAFLGG
ncbi:DUF4157 domain-containing protein [Microcoleus sp. FACHB-1]|nr:DUF4157 domain-containing protein [Microcoleus sp. FACHB-1]